MGFSFSGAGLVLSSIPFFVHGSEWLFPMSARFVVNYVLPPFYFKVLADPETLLTLQDQQKMLEAAIQAAPSEKWKTAADYIFVLTFEQRQGSVGFVAAFVAAIYAATLPLAQRHPLHFLFAVVGAGMIVGNLNHATDWSFLGYNPMVTITGCNLGIVFTPFWIMTTYCNVMGLLASKDAASKIK